jgi:hypothetical protein
MGCWESNLQTCQQGNLFHRITGQQVCGRRMTLSRRGGWSKGFRWDSLCRAWYFWRGLRPVQLEHPSIELVTCKGASTIFKTDISVWPQQWTCKHSSIIQCHRFTQRKLNKTLFSLHTLYVGRLCLTNPSESTLMLCHIGSGVTVFVVKLPTTHQRAIWSICNVQKIRSTPRTFCWMEQRKIASAQWRG